jgi:hypothetical protein
VIHFTKDNSSINLATFGSRLQLSTTWGKIREDDTEKLQSVNYRIWTCMGNNWYIKASRNEFRWQKIDLSKSFYLNGYVQALIGKPLKALSLVSIKWL